MAGVVEVDRLYVKKKKRYVVSDVSFTLESGEIVGLVGPSGSGKTTVMRTLVGTQIPTSGSVRVLGESPRAASLRKRSSVGYMSQDVAIYSDLSVRDNMAYFGGLVGVDRREMRQILRRVGMSGHERSRVETLSGGERRRVSLAIALLGRPSLLILDEPTVGLDPILRADLWRVFHELAQSGTTILVSSHIMDEAERCGRVLLMRGGEIIASDSPGGLMYSTNTSSVEEAFISIVRAYA